MIFVHENCGKIKIQDNTSLSIWNYKYVISELHINNTEIGISPKNSKNKEMQGVGFTVF